MIQNGYEEQITIKYSETDQNLAMKPYALLNFLQDIASKNAEDLGFGYSYISQNNLAWFLIKYRMEFNNYPVNIETIITECSNTYLRNQHLLSTNNQCKR